VSPEPQSSPLEWGARPECFGDLPRLQVLWRPIDWRRTALYLMSAVAILYLAATAVRVYARKYYLFLPGYVGWVAAAPTAALSGPPTHVFLLFVDHFEPDYDVARTRRWAERYAALASRHRDSTGRPPQHTWFYPGEQGDDAILETLRGLTAGGFGEVELHFHHYYDTAETLRPQLESAIADFQRHGFLKTIDGQTRFAFVHGNFSLDNANGPAVCGVNRELRLLRELGCFGDFTFPSVYLDSQPPTVNCIYAARDDDSPKSYRAPLPIADLERGRADLMIFQGPLVFAPTLNLRRLFLDLDDGDIHEAMPATPARVDRWLRANVHVPERPDWVFIKLFAHGISTEADEDAIMGDDFDGALSYLEQRYNDGRRYILHYVTAREAYNLARAAARGVQGDPREYVDSVIPPYVADGRR
jgi:hypothetical protein